MKSGRGFKDDSGVASNGFGVASLSRGEGGVILNICDGVFPLESSIFFDDVGEVYCYSIFWYLNLQKVRIDLRTDD